MERLRIEVGTEPCLGIVTDLEDGLLTHLVRDCLPGPSEIPSYLGLSIWPTQRCLVNEHLNGSFETPLLTGMERLALGYR